MTLLGDEEAAAAERRERLLRRAGREVRDALPLAARPRDVRRRVADAPHARRTRRSDVSKLFGIPIDTLARRPRRRLGVALGVVAALALRNRVFFRLGVRNVAPAAGRSALIVVGLMLGTTIIAAALATGDTMSHTIRASAVARARARPTRWSRRRAPSRRSPATASARPASRYFPQAYADRIARAARRLGLVDGVAPVDRRAGRGAGPDEPPERAARRRCSRAIRRGSRGFGAITRADGDDASRSPTSRPGEVYLNAKAADKLGARAGDRGSHSRRRTSSSMRASGPSCTTTGGATADARPAHAARARRSGCSASRARQGDPRRRTRRRRRARRRGRRAAAPGARAARARGRQRRSTTRSSPPTRQGAVFMSFFTTFGSFSIAAGILLIFLIFVMLAAERRGELGIARAVGTRRGHLVADVPLRGCRLRPPRGGGRRAARRRRRLRDGARAWRARSRDERTSTIAYAVSPRASSSRTRSACC